MIARQTSAISSIIDIIVILHSSPITVNAAFQRLCSILEFPWSKFKVVWLAFDASLGHSGLLPRYENCLFAFL
jgi:hypothetical protein